MRADTVDRRATTSPAYSRLGKALAAVPAMIGFEPGRTTVVIVVETATALKVQAATAIGADCSARHRDDSLALLLERACTPSAAAGRAEPMNRNLDPPPASEADRRGEACADPPTGPVITTEAVERPNENNTSCSRKSPGAAARRSGTAGAYRTDLGNVDRVHRGCRRHAGQRNMLARPRCVREPATLTR